MLMESPPARDGALPTIDPAVEARLAPHAWGDDLAERDDDVEEARGCEDASAAARLVRRALERAVDRATEGAARIAVLTGGGVDSSALLALADARARRAGGTAFAVALDFGGLGDDRPYLKIMEQHLGCEVVRVDPAEGAAHLDLLRGVDASPFVWAVGTAEVAMLRAARAHGADVVLSGVGADELFDGLPQSLAWRARRGQVRSAVRAARALAGFDAPRSPVFSWIARPLLARLQPRALRALRVPRHGALFTPSWAGARLRAQAQRLGEERLARALAEDPRTPLERFVEAPHREHLFWLRHQEQRASGVERRDPFHSRVLARLVLALPQDVLLAGDVRRGLFRRAVADLVPERVRERLDKASFAGAFARFFARARSSLRPFFEATETSRLGLVDAASFAREGVAALDAPDDLGIYAYAWTALATEAFLRGREAA